MELTKIHFKDPKVFITQVGLYNDENELLSKVKLSKPILNILKGL